MCVCERERVCVRERGRVCVYVYARVLAQREPESEEIETNNKKDSH